MSGATKSFVVFAGLLWLITAAALAGLALGNPTAINAVIGCSIPGVAITFWAASLHRQDRRSAQRRTH